MACQPNAVAKVSIFFEITFIVSCFFLIFLRFFCVPLFWCIFIHKENGTDTLLPFSISAPPSAIAPSVESSPCLYTDTCHLSAWGIIFIWRFQIPKRKTTCVIFILLVCLRDVPVKHLRCKDTKKNGQSCCRHGLYAILLTFFALLLLIALVYALPYTFIYRVDDAEETTGSGVPAAAVRTLEWGCEDGGTPFHVRTFEGVAALVALECCYSSDHSSKMF